MASPIPLRVDPGVPALEQFGFGRIVCAVNDCHCAQDAVHQATKLVVPGDTLTFVAVADAPGTSPADQATLDGAHAAAAVEAARAAAHADGTEASIVVVHEHDVSGAILEAAHDAGLLVVGAHGHWRIAHSSSVPALVARSRPELGFPGVVLVGTRGIQDRHAVVIAANIVAAHDTRVVLAHAGRSDPTLREALAEQAADVLEITGKDPVVVSVDGPPIDRLLGMASSIGASLVVLGSHSRRDPQTLVSLSDRVAQHATCSVLVLADKYRPAPG
ncbi:MAG TPA: universal stress protein [Thermoleophilaceae bacterium]|nr:universal stress protein [Thermoleophilaceae bacterium]